MKRICRIVILLGMIFILFYGASNQDFFEEGNAKKVEVSEKPEGETGRLESNTSQTEISDSKALETESVENSTIHKREPEEGLSENDAEMIRRHYGTYRIKKYLPLGEEEDRLFSYARQQEADLMLGRIIDLEPERFTAYGVGDREYVNYLLQRYEEQNPQYSWEDSSSVFEHIDRYESGIEIEGLNYFGKDYVGQIEGIITVTLWDVEDAPEKFTFYTFSDTDDMIMSSHTTIARSFLLERCEEGPKEPLPVWEEKDSIELLENIYGEYQVTEFLPTKFFPSYYTERSKFPMLPQEEADMMMGKIIRISEEAFITYDNYREPTSSSAYRTEDGFWLDKITMERPEYKVKTVRANEIYGIRDGILTGELAQEEYVEVDVYPGYETNREWTLPQMFLVDGGRILMYAMGEYFLLEKIESSEKEIKSDHMPDLSEWIGRYAFSEEKANLYSYKLVKKNPNDFTTMPVTREYEIEIQKSDSGEYYAEIMIHGIEDGTDTRIKANVHGSSETISIVFKKVLSGEKDWASGMDVLLRFQKEAGEIYTYWGGLNEAREAGKYFEKID